MTGIRARNTVIVNTLKTAKALEVFQRVAMQWRFLFTGDM